MRRPRSRPRTRKRKQKRQTRKRQRGGDEANVFHFWNQFHYGDNILNLKFLYNISEILKEKGISIKYYYDTNYNSNKVELERYLHPNGVVTLNPLDQRPGNSIGMWMGDPIGGVNYLTFDKLYKLLYSKIMNILGIPPEGINTSLYQPAPYLEDIYQKLNDKFKDLDILIINGKSNSLVMTLDKPTFNKETMDSMCDRLSKKYKIATTTCVNDSISCTMRDGLTLQDIGAISTHAKYIIGVHTGPLTACFTEATKNSVKKWIIFTNDGTTFEDINAMVVNDTYDLNTIEKDIN